MSHAELRTYAELQALARTPIVTLAVDKANAQTLGRLDDVYTKHHSRHTAHHNPPRPDCGLCQLLTDLAGELRTELPPAGGA